MPRGIFNAEVLLRPIVYDSTSCVAYKYIYTTILKIVQTPAIFYLLIKPRVKTISGRKGKLCGNFSLQSDKPDQKTQKLMSSKTHSCIFFLGFDTCCEGAISQVDDAMLSVIAS